MEQPDHLDVLCINDEKTFGEVFNHLHARLRYFAASLLTANWSAEDVVQEAFVRLWQRREDFNSMPAIKSFLYLTVRNQCFNINKHQKVVAKHSLLIDGTADFSPYEQQQIVEAEVLENMHRALQELPQGCRTVMHFSYFEGLQNKDIAARLKVSINTVKTQKKRALQILRTAINMICSGCLFCFDKNYF